MSKEMPIIPVDEDDLVSYMSLNKHIDEDNARKKNQALLDIMEMGDTYVEEIERKRKKKQVIQNKLIPYILKKTDDVYSKEELMSYTLGDVQTIYDEVKLNNKSVFVSIIKFLFGVE